MSKSVGMLARAGVTGRDIALWTAFLSLNTVTQLAFKAAGEKLDAKEFGPDFVAMAAGQPSVWLAIAGYLLVFAVWIQILKSETLSRAFLMTALVYVPVTIGAWLVFGEAIGGLRVLGIALIVVGVSLLGVEARPAGGVQRNQDVKRTT